jgi:hypothetical protein
MKELEEEVRDQDKEFQKKKSEFQNMISLIIGAIWRDEKVLKKIFKF